MSTWVRALCAKPLDGLTPDELRASIAQRLPALATLYGEDSHTAALARLTIENADPARPFRVWWLRYREGEAALRIERWTAPAEVKDERNELLERLEDCDEDGVEDVTALLTDMVEMMGIELKMSDVEGIGWAVAVAAAACFAERGDGLIQADGEGYLEPTKNGVEHVLDGD